MPPPKRFTVEKREQLLALIEAGRPVREAEHEVGISHVTVWKWATHGELAGATKEEAEFSRRYRAAVDALAVAAAEAPGSQPRFTPEKRGRFLELIAGGATITAACAEVGISSTTIGKWAERGERAATPDAQEFAVRYAEARSVGGQASIEPAFTDVKRERFLTLLETGRTVEEACADVGVSRATVNAWDVRGREGRDIAAAEFSARFTVHREAMPAAEQLSEHDLIRLLERKAKHGNVQAMKLLLDRLGKGAGDDDEDDRPPADPFTALEGGTVTQLPVRGRAS